MLLTQMTVSASERGEFAVAHALVLLPLVETCAAVLALGKFAVSRTFMIIQKKKQKKI